MGLPRRSYLMSTDTMDEVAGVVAQKNAMEQGCIFLPHGTRQFSVEKGWQSQAIRRDRGVAISETLMAFEAALRNPDVKVIFIPAGALMTDDDIRKICQRNGVAKTLFKEVEIV